MGGKNSAPKSPDYSQLAAASEASAKYSYDLASRQQDWAEKTYADNKSVSDTVISAALGALDKQTAWADADRQRYEDIYQPLEDQYAARAQDYATPERQEVEAGKAEADVAAQFDQARNTAQQHLESFGVDPSQTRQGALDLGSRVAEAAAQASAGNQARFRTEMYGDQLLSNAINTGKGYAQQVMGEQAGAGQSGNQAANTGLATTASGAQTMGTGNQWQQTGNQGVQGWGNILNAGFQNQLNSWKANQDSSSGWGSALGLVGGVAGTFMGGPAGGMLGSSLGSAAGSRFAEGGAIPDDPNDPGMSVPPQASPSGGAIPDDVPAQIDGQAPAQLNAGEFVVPKDVVSWLGEKGLQQIIMKSRKEMAGGDKTRPAQPEVGPPPPPPDGAGAIPMPQGV